VLSTGKELGKRFPVMNDVQSFKGTEEHWKSGVERWLFRNPPGLPMPNS